jgi:hypothetical protein
MGSQREPLRSSLACFGSSDIEIMGREELGRYPLVDSRRSQVGKFLHDFLTSILSLLIFRSGLSAGVHALFPK